MQKVTPWNQSVFQKNLDICFHYVHCKWNDLFSTQKYSMCKFWKKQCLIQNVHIKTWWITGHRLQHVQVCTVHFASACKPSLVLSAAVSLFIFWKCDCGHQSFRTMFFLFSFKHRGLCFNYHYSGAPLFPWQSLIFSLSAVVSLCCDNPLPSQQQ